MPTEYELGVRVGDGSCSISGVFPQALSKIVDKINISIGVRKYFFIEMDCIKAGLFVRVSSGVPLPAYPIRESLIQLLPIGSSIFLS